MRTPSVPHRCAVIGQGRLGSALASALIIAGFPVDGPLGRGADGSGADVVLLCVPDGAIAAAAAAVSPGPFVGHCSGATGLDVLAPHEAFGLHPLMTVTPGSRNPFEGAHAAVGGSTARAMALAGDLAAALGMHPFPVADADRAAYHAGASMASNFVVTLADAAQQVGGVDREALAPLLRAAVENWVADGSERSLTGPIARGDEATVDRQRAAVAERAPELIEIWDALAEATRAVAGRIGAGA
jgi:predicted short-subunit dehydrogenase-like oxidoreductase (DUF2520 family)